MSKKDLVITMAVENYIKKYTREGILTSKSFVRFK